MMPMVPVPPGVPPEHIPPTRRRRSCSEPVFGAQLGRHNGHGIHRQVAAGSSPEPRRTGCATLSYMPGTLTIRLDKELERNLDKVCARSGRTRSAVIRDALRRQLALARYEDLRRRVMPFAEARGYLVDEDVQRDVS